MTDADWMHRAMLLADRAAVSGEVPVGAVLVQDDRLLAELDFSNDTVTSLDGTDSTIDGIAAGYIDGDLTFTANFWNGSTNPGEFGVTGTFFEVIDTQTIDVGATNRGIAVADNATGSGYVLYSVQDVDSRFGDAYNGNADHLIAVRFHGGQWQYNNSLG